MARQETPYQAFHAALDTSSTRSELEIALMGCARGYILNPHASTYFAFEALSAIATDIRQKEDANSVPKDKQEADGSHNGWAMVEVPWLWIAALVAGWEQYKSSDISLGRSLGLEGKQGQRPTAHTLDRELEHRATAFWIWKELELSQAAGRRAPVNSAIEIVAGRFGLGHHTAQSAWKKFGREIKNRRHNFDELLTQK